MGRFCYFYVVWKSETSSIYGLRCIFPQTSAGLDIKIGNQLLWATEKSYYFSSGFMPQISGFLQSRTNIIFVYLSSASRRTDCRCERIYIYCRVIYFIQVSYGLYFLSSWNRLKLIFLWSHDQSWEIYTYICNFTL